jgi:hypothetical protein
MNTLSLPIQAIPYARLVKRLFLGQGSLESISYQRDILHPEEKATLKPALHLPGQIERVKEYKATDSWGAPNKEKEILAATSTTITHPPTIAYHFKNATLLDGIIYVGKFKQPIAEDSFFNSGACETHHLQTCALASTFLGTKYFGHWLADDCTNYLLAETFGSPLCLRMPESAFGHRQKYEKYFEQDWTPIDRARIEHLVIFQDFPQNSLKRARYQKLRDRIKGYLPQRGTDRLIYLRRGQSGVVRAIQNEDEIIDAVVKRGFQVIDIIADDLNHIIDTLANAKIVVSLEGSHLAHWIYTAPQTSGLLVLQPADRFIALQRAYAECLGIRYGFVVGDIANGGYHFPVSDILRTVDLLLDSLA